MAGRGEYAKIVERLKEAAREEEEIKAKEEEQQKLQDEEDRRATEEQSARTLGGGRGWILQRMQSMNLGDIQSSSGTIAEQTSNICEPKPVTRQGSSGKEVPLTGNYVVLKLDENKTIHQYEIKFNPDIDNRTLRRRLLNQQVETLGSVSTFDGTLLHLPLKLKNEKTIFSSMHPANNSTVELTVIYKRPILMTENVSFFNVLLSRVSKQLNLIKIGRNSFNPFDPYIFPQHELEVWPGYVTSIGIQEGGLLLNLNAIHRVMRQNTVRDFMAEIHDKDPNNMKERVLCELLGTSVLTRYNNRTYKVDDIDWDKNPQYKFQYKGQLTTLIDYYKTHHNVEIKDQTQPLLVHKHKFKGSGGETLEESCLLVPELCFMCGITDSMRQDWKVMKDLAQKTKLSPEIRREVINDFVKQVNNNDKARKIFADWGLTLESDTAHIPGRTLAPENIHFGNNVIQSGTNRADWHKDLGRKPVLRTFSMINWAIIFDNNAKKSVQDFIDTMKKVCDAVCMKIGEPKKVTVKDERLESYTSKLRSTLSEELNMIVVILKSNRSDYYNAIKKLCCVEKVCPSQVILQKTLARPDKLRGIVERIALQMNCKMGGALWTIKNFFSNLMVIGIDVYHSGTGRSSKGSVSAFVASLNKDLTSWHSKACLQRPGQEIIDLLKSCFISALTVYHQKNDVYPERIIVYRDGVGDGQFEMVQNYEIKQFIEACKMIDQNYKPKMTCIIVQKRINARIFEKKNKLNNPGPGTIVDSVITRRFLYDFYLVPQFVNQGTVTPTHYVVLHDGVDIKTDHLQRFTFKLCHLYYNWPGTIRVPAPCQYAHKLAYLVGESIKTEPDDSLTNTLYFL